MLEQGCDVSIKELDMLLTQLAEKKRKMEQEESERNMQILLDFLHCLRKQKVEELKEVCTFCLDNKTHLLVALSWSCNSPLPYLLDYVHV